MTSNMPLISVIIPIFNVEKYLNHCLEIICSQSYQNLEILLIDDGSTDSCSDICDDWARKDKRICVIHKQNEGLSSARNTGLDLAKGEYISFVDPDDYICQNLYTECFPYMNDYDIIAFYHFQVGDTYRSEKKIILESVNSHNDMIKVNYPKMLGFSVSDIINWNEGGNVYDNRARGMVWQFLFRASVIQSNHIRFKQDLIFQEDDIFTMECMVCSDSLTVIPTPLYNYVQHPESITYNITDQQELEKKLTLLKYKNIIRKTVLIKDQIDILDVYAGSNVLSILQIAVMCVNNYWAFSTLKNYIDMPMVKESVSLVPLTYKNIKFNGALFLLKCHAYRLLYLIVIVLHVLHINFGLKE